MQSALIRNPSAFVRGCVCLRVYVPKNVPKFYGLRLTAHGSLIPHLRLQLLEEALDHDQLARHVTITGPLGVSSSVTQYGG